MGKEKSGGTEMAIDANRYRFLRRMALSDESTQDKYKDAMEEIIPNVESELTEEMWDRAIDAAMALEQCDDTKRNYRRDSSV